MREVFQREPRIIVVSLALGLGGAACGSKSEAIEPVSPKFKAQKAQSAVFLEHKSATVDYFGDNRRRVTVQPHNLVFEEFCQGSNMHLRRLDAKTLEPVSGVVVEDARECRDGRITPEDFGEKLKPADQDFSTTL